MTTSRPNVLLVLVDQWPGPLLGAAGHPVIQTPTLEQGWVVDGGLRGFDPGPYVRKADRSFTGQRGLHYPEPPALAQDQFVGSPA